jgi:hypothetical protein
LFYSFIITIKIIRLESRELFFSHQTINGGRNSIYQNQGWEIYGECTTSQQISEFNSQKREFEKGDRLFCLREEDGLGHKTFRMLAR